MERTHSPSVRAEDEPVTGVGRDLHCTPTRVPLPRPPPTPVPTCGPFPVGPPASGGETYRHVGRVTRRPTLRWGLLEATSTSGRRRLRSYPAPVCAGGPGRPPLTVGTVSSITRRRRWRVPVCLRVSHPGPVTPHRNPGPSPSGHKTGRHGADTGPVGPEGQRRRVVSSRVSPKRSSARWGT